MRAPADGYTLLLVGSASAINATLYDKLNYDFIRDIAPVAGIIRDPNVLVVHPSVPAKTVPEFIAYAKANPGQDQHGVGRNRYARPCVRRAVQDDGRRRHGSRAVSRRWHRRSPICSAARCRSCSPPSSSIEYIGAGKLRALAVTTATRSQALPDIPTVGEFVPGYEASGLARSAHPRTRRPRSSTSSTRKSMLASPIPR